ncbi:MAG: amine oxidase, partial [Chloroflexi bacterium]|nr:amine oxidase [Chloroflexota bacterium]
WDLGCHVQFSHYGYYDDVLERALGDAWLWHERESWVWIRGRFVPYPFQLNLHRLDPGDREVSLRGLEQAATQSRDLSAANFAEWILATFGPGLAELFMYPYNRKVWGYPLEQLSVDWIGERVARPDLDRIRRNIAERRDDVSWGPNNLFRFPLEGGTGAIWKAVASLLPSERLRFGHRVKSVRPSDRVLTLENGQRLNFDTLISTVPLDVLTTMVEGLSAQALEAGRRLVHSSVHVIGVGLHGAQPETLRRKCWMYFPEPSSPYYRVTVFSNYSPRNVPPIDDCWSLMAEVCETPYRSVDPSALRSGVLAAMERDRLIPPGTRVVSYWQRREEYGYPTPFLGRDDALRALQYELEAHRIFSRGRFGAWKYEASNQDHSFMQGVELANRLVRGEPETTVVNPALANAGAFQRKPMSTDA